jgi:hypothetical protein
MNATNGELLANLVSLKVKYSLIKTWTLAKQLSQSSFKNSDAFANDSFIVCDAIFYLIVALKI